MENLTLENLLVAQVLTLAKTLELLNKTKSHPESLVNFEQRAADLISRERSAVLQLLGQKS